MAIEIITTGIGSYLVDACGEVIAAGHAVLNKTDAPRALVILLGDGDEGPWDSITKLYYHGEPLPADSYHFHPGTPSGGLTDPIQGVDPFFTQGLTQSHTAYIVVRLPDTIADDDIDPAGIIGRYKTRQLPNYDSGGQLIETSYSSNPARYAAFQAINKAKISPTRINWPSWCEWRDDCDTLISWNDGIAAGPRQIKRFEAHHHFTGPVNLSQALNDLTDLSAYMWQDDGVQVFFKRMWGASTPSFTFTEANIVDGSIAVSETDSRILPTRQIVRFRNLDNEYLSPAFWPAKLDSAIEQIGIKDAPERDFRGAMTYSQGQRISKFLLRRANLSKQIELRGDGSTYPVLPGDEVRIIHPSVDDINMLVIETEDEDTEYDSRRIVGVKLTEPLYSDADHEPIPKQYQVGTTPVVS